MAAKRSLPAVVLLLLSLVALLVGFGLPAAAQQPDRIARPVDRASIGSDRVAEPGPDAEPSPLQATSWTPLAVADDPLVRMPGTQPNQGVQLDGPGQCFNCHDDYGQPQAEPGSNWQGSMMAHAARDFLYWATLTVAGQDAIWAIGNPNATDICLRCHMPGGWLGGRSDPTNGSLMTGIDFDAVQCNLCHYLYDPFYKTTADGTREGNDWNGYWDETNASNTPSSTAAQVTYDLDRSLAQALTMFNGQSFYSGDLPPANYHENGSGQMFVSTLSNNRRASFADANASHSTDYSRYHKSKYFCSTCHDISNPVLHNLGADPTQPLPTETDSTYSYHHVERTFSEFMLSDYGLQGGSEGVGPYAPGVFETSQPGNKIASCQDCHMPDVTGQAATQNRAILRPDGSVEHPKSGVPQHDLTGGNMWVSYVLASAAAGSPNYDPTNDALLNQGPAVLTLDLTAGETFYPQYLLNGVGRAQAMLQDAAAIEAITYDPGSGALSFQVRNQTGHKLISGYPEGRRMFLNVRFYDGETLLQEINPYDPTAGTLKGLGGYVYSDPDGLLPQPAALAANELYVDELVYEIHNSSTLTGEEETFHFALGTHRYKDNRIPPKGFRIDEAPDRLSEPVWHGSSAPGYFSAAEYAGGYDAVSLDDYGILVPGADRIEISLNYQTTSREYIEFLRNEINASGELTLVGPGVSGEPAYIIGTDPFFNQLRAWGDTIWQLWRHNKDILGAAPVEMTRATFESPDENHAPEAATDVYTATEDVVLTVVAPGVLGNDQDADGDDLTAVQAAGPAHGTLSLSADGGFVYTPTLNFHGQDSFHYRADDGAALSEPVTVTLTVQPANDPPVAAADAYTTTEDVTLTIASPGVLGNDQDVDGDQLAAVLSSGPVHGALSLSADGSFVYTPTLNFHGQDSFEYRASDGTEQSEPAAVTLTVQPANDPPVAAADAYTTTEDVTLTMAAPGVLDNDQDVDGDDLAAVLATSPAHGALSLPADGGFVYTPTLNFHGQDSFEYRADDGTEQSEPVMVTLTVQPANDPPLAAADAYTTTEDVTLTIASLGVLDNDQDVDGDELAAVLATSPAHGTLNLSADGGFVYTPTLNFHGQDSFEYRADDGAALSEPVAVTLTVQPVNDPPVAAADTYTTTEDVTLTIPALGVLGNDQDVDGDDLAAVLSSGPVHGALSLSADGGFVYTPTLNYHGQDSFEYRADDGAALSGSVAVTLNIQSVNDPPVAASDHYTVTRNAVLNVSVPGVLGNDQDVDGDDLAAVLATGPTHGALQLSADGGFVYTPTLDFHGQDSFRYAAHDGEDPSAAVAVNLTVTIGNTPPLAALDSYTTSEDVALAIPAPGVLANDLDGEGNVLTAVAELLPLNGVLVMNANGSFVYTPTLNYFGQDSFQYRASDGLEHSEPVTVTLIVQPVNDLPVAAAETYSTTEDAVLLIAAPGVLANDQDIDGDQLAAELATAPAHGVLRLSADGGFVYTPTLNFHGQDGFQYRADDGTVLSAPVAVTLTIQPANDPPVAMPETYTTTEGIVLKVPALGVLGNDHDVDGDGLTAVLDAAPVSGTLALSADGSFVYTPTTGFHGQDGFYYHAHDGATASQSVMVRLVVLNRVRYQAFLPLVLRPSGGQAKAARPMEMPSPPY